MATPDLLKLVTAGSVDDGKSTLVGRLLHDTRSVLGDQMAAVLRVSAERGLADPDLSLLVDGLRAEREQGITIDVAYRYFATRRRSFVMADTPGHVQYTRNTVTGASTADHAILLTDARKGVLDQTRRHLAVMALLRVPGLTLAVNKLDLVDFSQEVFEEIRDEFVAHAAELGYSAGQVAAVPISALTGDNVATRSEHTPWYEGPTLLERLETVEQAPPATSSLRMPVQYVLRPEGGGERAYAGQIAAGTVHVGDPVVVLPAGRTTTVERIHSLDGPVKGAVGGDAVSLVLTDDIDISRGDLIAAADTPPPITKEFDATVCWLAEDAVAPGARLLVKHGTRTTPARLTELRARFDEQGLTLTDEVQSLGLNEIGLARLSVADALPVDDYGDCKPTGSFLLIDPGAGDTLGAGLIGGSLATRAGSST